MEETEYRYDTQLLIEGTDLDEDEIHDFLMTEIPGDCLIVVGDEELIKLHYHTNKPTTKPSEHTILCHCTNGYNYACTALRHYGGHLPTLQPACSSAKDNTAADVDGHYLCRHTPSAWQRNHYANYYGRPSRYCHSFCY